MLTESREAQPQNGGRSWQLLPRN